MKIFTECAVAIFSRSGLFTKKSVRRCCCRLKSIHVQYEPTKRWNLSRRTPTSVCEVQPLTTQEWEERWESGAVVLVLVLRKHSCTSLHVAKILHVQTRYIHLIRRACYRAFYFCCHSQLNQYNLLYHQAIIAKNAKHAQHRWKVFALYWKSTRESARNAQDSGNWLDFILIHTWKMALDRGHIFFNILHYLIPFIQESHWPPSHTSTFCTSFTSETINKNNSALCPNFSSVLAIKMFLLSCIALRDDV